ncbi:hypothetical protein [Alcaligenes faecalis]|uniref:hypothetical protein n=1 Tax=Alcaligenes faecalis TaxID=511 RepID=UPI0029321541|nr:hypothetical protein [Alcaligenes faecalis]MDV2114906.1 hypothetical protein [Alcaligenes faecalis]
MLIESAFSMLPESIAGYGFQRVRREANAVGSFAFSLLNALHAKNILDPIQRIQLENSYATKVVPLPVGGANRSCDIFLDYGGSKLGTARLANYGWRYRNFVEGKFFKSYRQTKTGQDSRASANSAETVADLIRLIALVPEPEAQLNEAKSKTSSARYFLCLSDYSPEIFINQYLKDLHSTFADPKKSASICIDLTSGKASKAFANSVGNGFSCLKIDISHATCFSHYPLDPKAQDSIWMLLIRIDSASITMKNGDFEQSFSLEIDRTIKQSNPGAYTAIRDFVAMNIK